MVATSPMRNDINSLGPGASIEMQPTTQAYLNQTSSSSSSWMSCLGGGGGDMTTGGGGGTSHHHMMVGGSVGMSGSSMGMMGGSIGSYDQLGGVMGGASGAGFGSDEEDCFDQMSDQDGCGDDSVSSSGGGGPSGLDETRIQQL